MGRKFLVCKQNKRQLFQVFVLFDEYWFPVTGTVAIKWSKLQVSIMLKTEEKTNDESYESGSYKVDWVIPVQFAFSREYLETLLE